MLHVPLKLEFPQSSWSWKICFPSWPPVNIKYLQNLVKHNVVFYNQGNNVIMCGFSPYGVHEQTMNIKPRVSVVLISSFSLLMLSWLLETAPLATNVVAMLTTETVKPLIDWNVYQDCCSHCYSSFCGLLVAFNVHVGLDILLVLHDLGAAQNWAPVVPYSVSFPFREQKLLTGTCSPWSSLVWPFC